MFIFSLMVAGIAAVLVSSYKIARSRVYAVGIVRKLPRSQDAVGEQAARLPGPTEVSVHRAFSDVSTPHSERTASDLSTGETASQSGLSKDATSRSPLFMGLSPADYKEIVSAAHEEQFARRQPIFLEGDPVRRVVLLTSGSAKIVQVGQTGTEIILGVRGPGEVVGTVGLRPQDRHASTAQALTPSTALVWDAAVFETLSQRSEHLRRNIIDIIRRQLEELEQRYREISTERVAARLSHQLVRLANQIGHRVDKSVEIRFSREELAQLTGMTLFTVSRLLSEWNQRGIVSTRREAVSVNNFQALAGEIESVTRPQETVHAPLPPEADSYRAVLVAADLNSEIEELKEALQAP